MGEGRVSLTPCEDFYRPVEELGDKKTLLPEVDASKKRNLILVGGYADNVVDLCGEGNADTKRQCLGKGQTMLTQPPSQAANVGVRRSSRTV